MYCCAFCDLRCGYYAQVFDLESLIIFQPYFQLIRIQYFLAYSFIGFGDFSPLAD